MNEEIRRLLERERTARMRARHHRRQTGRYERHANDLRLKAWRLQRRQLRQKLEADHAA